jgi:hypothetical protein
LTTVILTTVILTTVIYYVTRKKEELTRTDSLFAYSLHNQPRI